MVPGLRLREGSFGIAGALPRTVVPADAFKPPRALTFSRPRTTFSESSRHVGLNCSVGPLEPQPFALVVIPRNGSLLQKRIVDTVVVDGRRLRATVGTVVIHDEVAVDGSDLARVADLVVLQPLQVPAVFARNDGLRIDVAIVAECKERC